MNGAGNDRGLSPGSRQSQFKPGSVPNPRGRPRGSRNKISTKLLDALQQDFDEHGPAAIEKCRQTNVVAYLKLFTRVISKSDAPAPDLGEQLRKLSVDELRAEMWITVCAMIQERCESRNVAAKEVDRIMDLLGEERCWDLSR